MNTVTDVKLRAHPNGDLTISNDDGSVTIRSDGTLVISTVAPIQLVGETLGRLDNTTIATEVRGFLNLLHTRGKKR